jgi:hypothetical protein
MQLLNLLLALTNRESKHAYREGSAMDDIEFWVSPIGRKAHEWVKFTSRTLSFVDAVYRSVSAMIPLAALLEQFPEIIEKRVPGGTPQVSKAAALGKEQMDTEFGYLHAVSLMAYWGAFEAFIEDVCLAKLLMEPQLLESGPLGKVKIDASSILGDQLALMELILQTAFANQKSALKLGKGTFESRLEVVGLDGNVPKELGDDIFVAQKVRNVWAHRAGIADKRFVDECSGFFFYKPGDPVEISRSAFERYVYAISVYGTVIINRYREKQGLSRISWPGKPGSPTSYEKTHIELYDITIE